MKTFKKKLSLEKFVISQLNNTHKITGGNDPQETVTGIPDSDACYPPRD